MKRRSFLSLLGAVALAPSAAVSAARPAAMATCKRATFGYAVFWARHGGQFGAAQLAKALQISDAQAKAMIEEMLRDRLVRVAGHSVTATTPHGTQAATTAHTNTKQSLYWRFRRVGMRARALNWQL